MIKRSDHMQMQKKDFKRCVRVIAINIDLIMNFDNFWSYQASTIIFNVNTFCKLWAGAYHKPMQVGLKADNNYSK